MKKIAVVGALGAVGTEMLNILAERGYQPEQIIPFDIPANAGKTVKFAGNELEVQATYPESFKGIDAALLAIAEYDSKDLAPKIVEQGCVLVDNSSSWRMGPEVPLVIPEVNPEDLEWHKGIIANPNCATIIAMVPLKPLHDYGSVKRIIASTYQAASGAGGAGLTELEQQTRQALAGEEVEHKVFAHQLAFNLIPHIDYFEENGFTHEEMKMFTEGRKILHLPELAVNCTCVRVPVYRSHSESITIETEKEISVEKAKELLANAPGVVLVDNPEAKEYPMPKDSTMGNDILVGRIRKDPCIKNALTFWCCGDQLRKGAALNAVQIVETLIARELI